MVTLFSQQGLEPALVIHASGDVELQPQTRIGTIVRFSGGAFHLGPPLPPGAAGVPLGWEVMYGDGRSILGTNVNSGYELMRGTFDRTGWQFAPAFGKRFPPTPPLLFPTFIAHPAGEPTIVYVGDPRSKGNLTVRLPDGQLLEMPAWGSGAPGDYRVSKVSAIELPGEPRPIVAAKIDDSIVVGYPDGEYAMRALVGVPRFDAQPPPGSNATLVASATGPHCSEVESTRDREEVYDPQLFAWNGAGLAFLSMRVHEKLRWTLVPVAGKTPADDRATCDWIVDGRSEAPELVVMRLDARSAREVARIPVEYRPGNGFHGAGLMVARDADVLHAVATSYGVATYTRVALPH
jgi:hypothetical protein